MNTTNQMKFTTKNGYMTIKIALPPTEITRTLVVPECMTLTDLNDAIQCVMGWEDSHLWHFQDGREGALYELPHEESFPMFGKSLCFDAGKVTLGKAFPKRGAKLTYEYDFGDSWEHVVTRMADPKTAEIVCAGSAGPDGLEDFGGQYKLAAFIDAMRKNPEDEEWAEEAEWCGFDDPERLAKYLEGESAEKKTAKLRNVLSHVKVVVPAADEKPKKMSDEEKARLLGLMFATAVPVGVWEVLQDALQHKGKCEFVDHDQTVSTYLMTMFDGIKIKDGVRTVICTNPSKLTVPKKWVEWYATHGKDWEEMRWPFDLLEAYAMSSVHLYGAVTFNELYAIIRRYDPGFRLPPDEVVRYLETRALWCGIGYRMDGDMIVDNDSFSETCKDSDEELRKMLETQKGYPRWYPASREELFKWEVPFVPERTPEVDQLELVVRSLGVFTPDQVTEMIGYVFSLMSTGVPPEAIYKSMVAAGLIEKMTGNRRKPLLDALGACCGIVRLQFLNGNTIRDIDAIEAAKAAEPKISRNAPCPCGSGKKYKLCCGRKPEETK